MQIAIILWLKDYKPTEEVGGKEGKKTGVDVHMHTNNQYRLKELTAKSFGTKLMLWETSISYMSRAECPTAKITASNPNFWISDCELSFESETLTPTIRAFSMSRSSTLVPNLIVT